MDSIVVDREDFDSLVSAIRTVTDSPTLPFRYEVELLQKRLFTLLEHLKIKEVK